MSDPHAIDSDKMPKAGLVLPDAPALLALRLRRAAKAVALLVSADGEIDELSAEEALSRLEHDPVMVVHGGFTARRIAGGSGDMRVFREPGPKIFDLLELFAFVYPARPCLPTPDGLMRALGMTPAATPEDLALQFHEAAALLLTALTRPDFPQRGQAAATAWRMTEAGWAWGPGVVAALGDHYRLYGKPAKGSGFDVWNLLPDWEDMAPRAPASSYSITADETEARLAELAGPEAEQRPGQKAFARIASEAFAPRERAGAPIVVLAEAGTGIGKTIGYIAPASLWAERNKGTVWLSTYTKNLQRQLDQELTRLYPDPAEKSEKAVIRKGRENYLCLLNYAESADRAALSGAAATAGLVARWALASRDGDMVGGDFPAWLAQRPAAQSLTDRRGECVYAACPHFKKCFIEKAIRKAHRADIVVANHALVMRQAAVDLAVMALNPSALTAPASDIAAGAEDEEPSGYEARTRFVFDEGHHIFDAADSAFSAHLSILETAELRRWIRGSEGQRGRRGRGLDDRVGELISGDSIAEEALDAALSAAAQLPGPGWQARLNDGQPQGAAEQFLSLLRSQVHARAPDDDPSYSLETDILPCIDSLVDAARQFERVLARLAEPMKLIAERMRARLAEGAEDLDTATRIRLDAAARGLDRRAMILLPSWRSMLAGIDGPKDADFVEWFSVERIAGREIDAGMHRHWRDPTIPFSSSVLETAHGVLIASATLRDEIPHQDDTDVASQESWQSAEIRTGASHLVLPARRAHMASPFNYQKQARIFVVRDVSRTDLDAVAAAYRALFMAAGGGALGLFTAIRRLRGVHERISASLEAAGLPLYAQHIDGLDTGTLVDIFRADRHACLLGTDAVRDGVDVPGDSLRMIVFDRTPWPRPDLLHKARREIFGGARYDDMITRLRLKQAFGRLIRTESDKGVFVALDSRLPSRLATAFPPGVPVERVGLAEAVAAARDFLAERS